MVKIDFEKLKKHVNYTLSYNIEDPITKDVAAFDIVPNMKDLPAFMKIIQDRKGDSDKFTNWIVELITRDESPTEEEKGVLVAFVEKNYGALLNQTMIGFRLISKEDLDSKQEELRQKFEDKTIEKNL
jgi:hypothetical protein